MGSSNDGLRAGPVHGAAGPLARLREDRRGTVAGAVGLLLVPLVIAVGTAVDVGRAVAARTSLRTALDAAALAAAQETSESAALATVERFLRANYDGSRWGELSTFNVSRGDLTVEVDARATVPTTLLRVIGLDEIEVGATAEVTVGGSNLEVALVLDVTGSMAGQRITDLKAAANDLIDIVVRDVQTPFYSKVSVVPYSMGVNVGTLADTVRGSITGGTCSTPGCAFYKFTNANGGSRTFPISTCVSERTGPQAYTDASPVGAPVGRNYTSVYNPCPAAILQPLSTSKVALKATVASFNAVGSTAGQIGLAWGWYTLSPTFGVWTGASVPAAYDDEETRKILVLMTDGEFNTAYCNGVVAKDSTSGSGSSSEKINCKATNGSSFSQASQLCTAIKAKGITIYTVGFGLGGNATAINFLRSCASSAQHAYTAENGSELKTSFQQIAARISKLRLSR